MEINKNFYNNELQLWMMYKIISIIILNYNTTILNYYNEDITK